MLIASLLAWMHGARRDLPWRRGRVPYAVWISEVMLQQTQAATVVPYYERWLRRFPDIATLANAPLEDVLKGWEGLGYYARARNLHRMAQEIMAHHDGQIPADRATLLALPGIGRYTAGAILSLAFGQREPAVDGNVRRVLCRVYDIADDPTETATERRLWEIATALVNTAPAGAAGDLNEALMELGALLCTPTKPDCAACPISAICLAHARGVEAERPVLRPRSRTPHYDAVAAVIRGQTGEYLLIQRPPSGLLGGLWGFPGGVLRQPTQREDALSAGLRQAVQEQVGIEIAQGAEIARIKHAYTHFRITLHAFYCQITAGQPQPLGCTTVRWVAARELMDFAFPVTDAKIRAIIQSTVMHHAPPRHAEQAGCATTASRSESQC
jgi:A/G-specific adenine glycosylase